MSCNPGDLVGIPFPYSDLKAEKRRPVLVITREDRHGDFLGAAVTSVPVAEPAVRIDNSSLKSGQLPRQSWIRCDKIFTLSKDIIVRHYGRLHDHAFAIVKGRICAYLGCE
jgi:mRNA interferase MazF